MSFDPKIRRLYRTILDAALRMADLDAITYKAVKERGLVYFHRGELSFLYRELSLEVFRSLAEYIRWMGRRNEAELFEEVIARAGLLEFSREDWIRMADEDGSYALLHRRAKCWIVLKAYFVSNEEMEAITLVLKSRGDLAQADAVAN